MPILKQIFFPLMSNKWTDQRNQSSLKLMKSELMVAINYDYSSKEFMKFAQEDILSSAASVEYTYRLGLNKHADL
jgi:hypothetical protein